MISGSDSFLPLTMSGKLHVALDLIALTFGHSGIRMNAHTVKDYVNAMMHGSKYVYQAIPRILTLWLDGGENPKTAGHAIYAKINNAVSTAIDTVPMYKVRSTFLKKIKYTYTEYFQWFTAFPQIVSRVGHSNPKVYALLSRLISRVIRDYPHQALWLFASVVKSTKANREMRGRAILDALRVSICVVLASHDTHVLP